MLKEQSPMFQQFAKENPAVLEGDQPWKKKSAHTQIELNKLAMSPEMAEFSLQEDLQSVKYCRSSRRVKQQGSPVSLLLSLLA